jgi:hypothetical protein
MTIIDLLNHFRREHPQWNVDWMQSKQALIAAHNRDHPTCHLEVS